MDTPLALILLTGAALIGALVLAVRRFPDAVLRGLVGLLSHTLYRVRVIGSENIPATGGALLVPNHLSLADAYFVMTSTRRPIRFVIDKGMYEKWWVNPFAKLSKAIPISADAGPRELVTSLRTATECLKAGEVVCIFAEGQISRIGHLLPFRAGLTRIMKGVDAPIIPIQLDQVWGSLFSYSAGRLYWKWPRQLPYPITVSVGAPLPSDAQPEAIRQAVQELGAEAWVRRKDCMTPLPRAFVRTARRHPFRQAMVDATSKPTSFIAALARCLYLCKRLQPVWQGQEKVGILLPPSVPGALVNFAAMLMGKVPVNLNYTLSAEAIASCIRQCHIETVVTSAAFMEKLNLKLPVQAVLIEEVAAKPQMAERMVSLFKALFCPAAFLQRAAGAARAASMDDLATIIFSSGSTGEPKGVMLTHYNVCSNLEQIDQVFAFDPDERLLGVLPFFHSFGFTGTLASLAHWGIGMVYHYNPTDSKMIGTLVERHAVTFLLATPTFLQIYMRGCQPAQFGSLRFVMVGAEKLPDRVATAFEEKFGIRPMEAYGCTELSPAAMVNTRFFRSVNVCQSGCKRGTIGLPLPGMAVRIVDVETGELKGAGDSGLMLVKGPNVMSGYLGNPEKTRSVIKDGWYTTGDIATIDEDGFVTITDRLSRFSKIGGEMVPHLKIEERLHELAARTEATFAVTSLPDAKKGEKLMVLHTLNDTTLATVLEKFANTDLPNLWKPKADQFIHADHLPLLGTGKLDLRKVKELAAAADATRQTSPEVTSHPIQ